ncbi:MAG: tRNA (adenosine(37)-N6)-threonylcarbamoyltransferase complex ATPase subunit type 1 TsaE [Candidatus Aminicenantes bacterium]|nr:tRNA (adenosine(37)-N6)-threonylcarbamoyltransferase complex ATPase subunit type 1 TsaE [Candidatus Aminicenantes bacterium]
MNSLVETLVFETDSEEETYALAKYVGQSLSGKEVIYLTGELGAGKTVFVRGLAAGLGVEDESSVCSPSFTLVNVYQGCLPLYHVDLYRLEDEEEIADLGLEDYLGEGVMAIEWSEKMGQAFRGIKKLEVSIEVISQEKRKITIRGLENFPELHKVILAKNV